MKRRGVVTLVFDDGYEHIYRQIVPLLDGLHLPGVFAVPLDSQAIERSEQRAVTQWQQWLSLQGQGHEIAAHGIGHKDLAKLSAAELNEELRRPKEELGATTIVYPGGSVSQEVIQQAAVYYKAGRTTRHGFETLPPTSPLALRTYNFTRRNFSLYKANILALWAYLTGKWLIETYHIVNDHEHEKSHAVPLRDFKRHVAFLKRLPVEVKTIRAVMNPL